MSFELKKNESSRLYIGNLHESASEGDIIKLFNPYGAIIDVTYMWHKSGPLCGKPKGFAFVQFSTVTEAKSAMKYLSNKMLKGRKIIINFADYNSSELSHNRSSVSTTLNQMLNDTITKKRMLDPDASESFSNKKVSIRDINEKIKRVQHALQSSKS